MKFLLHLAAMACAATVFSLSPVSAQTAINTATVAHAVPMTATEQENLNTVLDWWRVVIEAGHLEQVPKYQSESYIQHNPDISTGRAAFLAAFGQGNKPVTPIPPKLESPPTVAGGRGEFVWILWESLSTQSAKNPQSYYANSFELLRVSGGQIQEHWDTAQKDSGSGVIEFGITPKPLREFNVGQLSTDEVNAQAVAISAAKDVYLGHGTESIGRLFANDYVEHDPNIAKVAGASHGGALETFVRQAKSPTALKDLEPELVLVNGEYVFMVWTVTSPDPDDKTKTYPWNYFQLIRVHDGKVVEHWDQERYGKSLLN